MDLRIKKRGSSTVHAAHRTDGVLVSECGAGEQYNGRNRQKPWVLSSPGEEVTCKRCVKKIRDFATAATAAAEVDHTEPGIALAYMGDRQAWISRDGSVWVLVDDYTDTTVSSIGATLTDAVQRWGSLLGFTVAEVKIRKEF